MTDSETPILERLVRRGPPERVGERCEMCSVAISEEHGHVVDVRARGLLCVCRPCYLLFTPEGAGQGHYRAVPDRRLDLGRDSIGPQQWDLLEVPVSVAFFFHNSDLGHVVGIYPGPAGATESALALEAWDDLAASIPVLSTLQPDVEAVLVRGGKSGAEEAYLVPIDVCYGLTGKLRAVWRGIDGGSEARRAVEEFFADLAARSEPAESVR